MKILTIILGALITLGGLYCIFTPGMTFLSLGWLIGLLLLINGISLIVDYFLLRKTKKVTGWDLFGGIVTLVLGILLLTNQAFTLFTDAIIIYFFAFWVLFAGIIRIIGSFRLKKIGVKAWGWVLAIGIIMTILGIYAFFHPIVAAMALGILVGLAIVMTGIDIITLGALMGGKNDEEIIDIKEIEE